jgi:alpha-galactosidase
MDVEQLREDVRAGRITPMPKDRPDPLLTYNVFFNADLTNVGTVGKDQAFLWNHLKLAQDYGFEAFVVDAIWFPGGWWQYQGPWIWDPKRYPDGGKPFEEFCRHHGMKFGLWCSWGRCFDQAEKTTHQIVADNRLGYFKHDLQGLTPGGGYQGTLGYYKVQDSLRKAFPDLILEDCCDGGTIKDFGIMSHAHYVVTTDNISALPDRMGIYDSTFVFPPMVLQNYTSLNSDKPGPYLWRSGMMGAWVIDVPPLPEQAESIRTAVRTYKSWIRPILRDCKVHHVLPRPDGKQWDGLFYWGPSLKKGVLFVFRPQSDQDRCLVKLRGLDPKGQYWVWSEDGAVALSLRNGEVLMQQGLDVSLPTPMSSDLVFLQDGALGKPAAK